MLRPIPNDTDGPHYELVPQDGLSQSLALVPILEQGQNDLPDAKIYWKQPEDATIEPLYGTLTKNKDELPRIELFQDQIDREAVAMQKFKTVKNEEAQLDLARTLLIKSYDDLLQSITPKRQEENILQIYNEELLKQIAKDVSLNKKKLRKQANKKVIMSTKNFILETERNSPRFEFQRIQRDLSKIKIPSLRRNYPSLPVIELPTNTQFDQPLPQYYILSQLEEIMPSIRNNLLNAQEEKIAHESALVLSRIRPTISESVKSLPPVILHKDSKNSHDKVMTINDNLKITKNIPFKSNSVITLRDDFLDKNKQSGQSASKYDTIVRQFEKFPWSNENIPFESNNTMPQRTTNPVLPNESLGITQSDWRAQYGHDYAGKSSKSKQSLKESIPDQNLLRSQNTDSKLVRVTDAVHVKDIEKQFLTNDGPLENQILYIANNKTDIQFVEKTRDGKKPQFNDDSKLCRLKGGKLICDVPMEPFILKEPISNTLATKHQINEEKDRNNTTRVKLTVKQRSSTLKRRYLNIKKRKASDEEEMPDKYRTVYVKTTKKYVFKNNFNKKRISKFEKNPVRWVADD